MDDEGKGGADFSLVRVGALGKPACVHHGSMNKVTPSPPGIWRCITLSGLGRHDEGTRPNPCRAACQEKETP